MTIFGNRPSEKAEDKWRHQLDRFVKNHQQELAALAWGLFLERGDRDDTIGLDLQPKPHFVYCSREALDTLNRNVDNKIQEILGVVDAHQPEREVLIISIGNGQLKLIFFEPEPSPAVCFEQVGENVNTLLERLEEQLALAIQPVVGS
ncbi:MAG: hypothetical protein F6J86_36765 [Symploca sp. SIO1B1]|nr:hypothetical protein [Symploca sp. SIO1C2]NER99315.1 hypothetical protein [Symploca sp. SIO1B1]